jgi:hypothetical protein
MPVNKHGAIFGMETRSVRQEPFDPPLPTLESCAKTPYNIHRPRFGWFLSTHSPVRFEAMIIRLSTDLAKHHGVRLHEAPPPEDNGYLDWTCRRFDANARSYLMMTNTNSLYTMLEAADDAREIGLLNAGSVHGARLAPGRLCENLGATHQAWIG